MKALITGVTGQDGHYLSELLLKKGYKVFGLVRPQTTRKNGVPEGVVAMDGDITDAGSVDRAIRDSEPDEIYNLAGQSHVGTSFKCPDYTIRVNLGGLSNVLESARVHGGRVYQASSSEMFGVNAWGANEETPFIPLSPYGASKTAAHHLVRIYRDSYGVFAVSGIAFNHESHRRGQEFVTQCVVRGVANVAAGGDRKLSLGNVAIRRDWGHAKDYVEAMWLMMQAKVPKDYVIATGVATSLTDWIGLCASAAGIPVPPILISQQQMRPLDVTDIKGDPTRIREELGWEAKVGIRELAAEMVATAMDGVNAGHDQDIYRARQAGG